MKKISTFAAIIMIGLMAFSSCTKKSSGSSNTMSATIGSSSFNANHCIFSIVGGTLTVYGYNGSGTTVVDPSITLGVVSYTSGATGTYNINDTSLTNLNLAAIDSSSTVVATAQTGTITITSASSSSIKGTFSFTCTDGTKVTGGSFTATNN